MDEDADTTATSHGVGGDSRSIGDLTKQVSRDATALVRAELALAKAEVGEKAAQSGMGLALLCVAAVVALAAVGALTAAAIMALTLVLAGWLSALIVAAAGFVIVGIVAKLGVTRLWAVASPLPEQTVESLKEDVQWVKQHAKSGLK